MYFNYGVFNTQFSTKVIPRIATGLKPNVIIKKILGFPSGVRNRAVNLFKFKKAPNYNINKIIADTSQRLTAFLENQFPFYVYAKTFWFQHIQGQLPIMYNLLLRAIRITLINVNIEGQDGQTPLWWAMENGYEAVMKLLLEINKMDIKSKDRYG